MRYDKDEGLVYFTVFELGIIHERRSPIDYRAMLAIAPKVGQLAAACSAELLQLYSDHEDDTVANRGGAIARLRNKSQRLDELVLGIQSIADGVEIEQELIGK